MSRSPAQNPQTPEFARPVTVARLKGAEVVEFDEAATEDERRSLARLFGATAVKDLAVAGRIAAVPGGWLMEARLTATVLQPCVVTLAPVKTRINQPIRRRFLADPSAAEDDDEVEALGPVIDPGLIAIEEVALALPPYPRAPGASLAQSEFGPPGAAPVTEEKVRPFADLARLRDKLGRG